LLRQIANAAGIEQNHVGLFFRIHPVVATVQKLPGNLFGIPFVHLTAIGLKEYRRHGINILPEGRPRENPERGI